MWWCWGRGEGYYFFFGVCFENLFLSSFQEKETDLLFFFFFQRICLFMTCYISDLKEIFCLCCVSSARSKDNKRKRKRKKAKHPHKHLFKPHILNQTPTRTKKKTKKERKKGKKRETEERKKEDEI